MPIFEYICSRCGENFEAIVFRKDQKIDCPKCRSAKVEKQVSAFAVNSQASSSSSAGSCGPGSFT